MKLNKYQIIIGGVITIILITFMINSYQLTSKQNESHKKTYEKAIEKKGGNSNGETYIYKPKKYNDTNGNEVNNDNTSNQYKNQKVFIYSSDSYDIEKPNGDVLTRNVTTYHIFNFDKKTVTLEENGKTATYPFTRMYEEKGLVATTYVLEVNTLGVQEIWWSPDVPNLGYDFDDGTRIACYDIKIKKN